jgi:hypothetical protein
VFRNGWRDNGWGEGSWSKKMRKFAPEAIAATLEQLNLLARAKIPFLGHAVIVLRRECDAGLTEADRDRLWDAFRVPVFEQIIGEDGELLASECEAHDGLHVESPKLPRNPEDVDPAPCACGRITPRLFPVRHAAPERSAAAHA